MERFSFTQPLLRFGVAFAFMYPAISAWFDPYVWIGYFPRVIHDLVGTHDLLLLHAFGVLELVLAVWIISGRRIFFPSAIASLVLTAIIVTNLKQMDVLFRDVPILCMSLVLAIEAYRIEFTEWSRSYDTL
ncbi:MAG: hypothetical protein WDZ93_04125 [Candidatus Paceibacterota bacterium]